MGGVVVGKPAPNVADIPTVTRSGRCQEFCSTPHPPECALDDWSDWDHVIENDGTLEEFEDKARALLGDPKYQ